MILITTNPELFIFYSLNISKYFTIIISKGVYIMHRIITIGREFGSGGRELGRRLSEKLGYAYYDQEIIAEISKRTALSEEYVRQITESMHAVAAGRQMSVEKQSRGRMMCSSRIKLRAPFTSSVI